MSLYMSDDGIIGGERINPPEYQSDNFVLCVRCGTDIDLDDDEYTEEDDGYVCDRCNAVTEEDEADGDE
jgi:DNA-directed RNA polymerase subunit RPC12/RpoP